MSIGYQLAVEMDSASLPIPKRNRPHKQRHLRKPQCCSRVPEVCEHACSVITQALGSLCPSLSPQSRAAGPLDALSIAPEGNAAKE